MTRIGVDTNVLVRLFVTDDEVQHELSKAFFSSVADDMIVVVDRVVLAEFYWVLRARYGQRDVAILDIIDMILERSDIEIEDRALVEAALAVARDGADLSDALIATANQRNGCRHTVTFDRQAAKAISSMSLLS